jgi:ribonuclease P protein component
LQRLKTKAQFQVTMAGPPVAKTPHFALHLSPLAARPGEALLFPAQMPWVGVLIPKRWARRAVTRNTIRRQIYEVARLSVDNLPTAAMVVRLRSEFSRKQFISATSDLLRSTVRAELQLLLGKVRPAASVHPSDAGGRYAV